MKNALKKCCRRTHPGKPTGVDRDGASVPGYCADEPLHERVPPQPLGDRDQDDQHQEADRQQPQQVEPPGTADPDPRSDPADLRDRARPSGRIDHILARRQLVPIAANVIRRDTRRRRSRQIFGGSISADRWSLPRVHRPAPSSLAPAGRSRSPRTDADITETRRTRHSPRNGAEAPSHHAELCRSVAHAALRRDVGVTPEMPVAEAEQGSRDGSRAVSTTDRPGESRRLRRPGCCFGGRAGVARAGGARMPVRELANARRGKRRSHRTCGPSTVRRSTACPL